MTELTCFKAYDIRGQLGTQLDEDVAYRIGRAYAAFLQPKTVVVGSDVRETSPTLKAAFSRARTTPAWTSSTSACAARKKCTSQPPTWRQTAAAWSPRATIPSTTTA